MTPSDGPLLVDTGSGLTIRYMGRNLYSPNSPILAAEKRADSYEILPETLLFVPSPLFFYGIEHLVPRLPQEAHLLCVEVDQQLMRISLDHTSVSVLGNPLVTYLRTDSADEVLHALHRIGVGRFRRCMEVVVNGGRTLRRKLYATMYRTVEYEILSYWRNRMTLMHMAHLWTKNFFLNLPSVAVGGDLASLTVDRPVVVAGAGESLEETIPVLESLRKQYYLIAVDTAVSSLAGNGIRPDAVMVLDGQSANLPDLIGFDTSGAALIADATAYPECIRRFAGDRWFFFSEFAQLGLFSRARAAGLLPTAIPPLGSVGVAALHCALSMTREAVLFAGLDFSYQAGKTHARGAPALVMRLLRSGRLSPLDDFAQFMIRPHRAANDKAGRTVWTDNAMEAYRTALEIFVTGRRRIFDLGATGLPNPAPRLKEAQSVKRVLETRGWQDAASPAETSIRKHSPEKPKIGRIASARQFLADERERAAHSAELVIRAIASGRIETDAGDELKSVVRDQDYVYIHFPDWAEEPIMNESFLKRFVESSETCLTWIDRVLSRVSRGN